jgi:flagellar biosynthesis chaperone FliJ
LTHLQSQVKKNNTSQENINKKSTQEKVSNKLKEKKSTKALENEHKLDKKKIEQRFNSRYDSY